MSDFSPMPTQWEYYAQQEREANQQAAQNAGMYNAWAQSNADDRAYRDQAANYWKQRQLGLSPDVVSLNGGHSLPASLLFPSLPSQATIQPRFIPDKTYRNSGQPGMYTTTWNGQEINPAFQNWWNAQQQNQGKKTPWDYTVPANQQTNPTPNFIGPPQIMPQEAPQVIDPRTVPGLADIMRSLRALQNKTADRWPENIWQQGI